MKSQFDQTLLSSFYLWFENQLLSVKSEAYVTGLENKFKLTPAVDIPSNYYSYQGAYKQLVAESGVSTPNSGFYVNGSFTPIDSPNFFVDFNNGRVIVPKASGANLIISGASTVKEINTYISYDDDEKLIMHGDFREADDSYPYFIGKDEKLDENVMFLPACFINIASSDNKEFSFGGEEETKNRIRVAVLTRDNYLIDAVLSLFRDKVREKITHVPYEQYPYGVFDSLKSYPYSYDSLIASQPCISQNVSHIEKVTASKITSQNLKQNLGRSFSFGFIEFDVSTYRFPRL